MTNTHKDITGHRYGNLKVLERLPRTGKYYEYKCLCDCGKVVTVKSVNLRSGMVKSCGCRRHRHSYNRLEDREDAIIKRCYSSLKKRHRKFAAAEEMIDYDSFKRLALSSCVYCGTKGSRIIPDRLGSGKKTHICSDVKVAINGIDRLDSSKGYTKDNCVSCCSTCNFAKSTMTVDEFKAWVEKVYCNFSCWEERIKKELSQPRLF